MPYNYEYTAIYLRQPSQIIPCCLMYNESIWLILLVVVFYLLVCGWFCISFNQASPDNLVTASLADTCLFLYEPVSFLEHICLLAYGSTNY